MKHYLLIFLLAISFVNQARSIKDITDEMRLDSTMHAFILQFKGSESYQAIKNDNYKPKYWITLADADDPLAAFVLADYFESKSDAKQAIKYTEITYVQTKHKTNRLLVLQSVYSIFGRHSKSNGATYLLSQQLPSFVSGETYQTALSKIGSRQLEIEGEKLQRELVALGAIYSNKGVSYMFESDGTPP